MQTLEEIPNLRLVLQDTTATLLDLVFCIVPFLLERCLVKGLEYASLFNLLPLFARVLPYNVNLHPPHLPKVVTALEVFVSPLVKVHEASVTIPRRRVFSWSPARLFVGQQSVIND